MDDLKTPKDPLESLRNRLYANEPVAPFQEDRLSPAATPTPLEPWKRTEKPVIKERMHATTIFFLIAVGFFAIAASVAAFLFYKGTRSISSDHITISVAPPTATIASGDDSTITVTVRNENPLAITHTNLFIDFPTGTLEAGTSSVPLPPYSDTLGDMSPGDTVSRTVSGEFFGGQNQVISIPIRFQYRAKGSNALFTATSTYQLTISTSPVSVQVSSLNETAAGQPLTVSVSVHSNAAVKLNNLAVIATYPNFGFAYERATPEPKSGSYFLLGSLAPGETKTVAVTGILTGLEGSEGTFNFAVGTAKDDGTSLLASTFTSSSATLRISHPFIGTTLTFNNTNADTVIVAPETPIAGTLSWVNNLSQPISDVVATISLTGAVLDPRSVRVQGGFYRSSDNTILFTKENNPGLANLAPGDTGIGTFTFATKPLATFSHTQNPAMTATVSVSGVRAGQGNVPQAIKSTVVKTIKIGTNVTLTRKLLHQSGPIANTGPTPPIAGTETTYTVQLTALNTVNSVGGAKESMALPSYVRFISPSSTASTTPITYDQSTRTVTWNMGDLAPTESLSAVFKIGFLPSISQANASPVLLNEASFTGTDRFTQQAVTATSPAMTLQEQSDPTFTLQSGTVHS